MKFNFEFNPSQMTGETIIAIFFMIIIFIVIPLMLGIAECYLTRKNKQVGLYLMIGTFATAILLGFYSLYVGILLLIVYFITLNRIKDKSRSDKAHDIKNEKTK